MNYFIPDAVEKPAEEVKNDFKVKLAAWSEFSIDSSLPMGMNVTIPPEAKVDNIKKFQAISKEEEAEPTRTRRGENTTLF